MEPLRRMTNATADVLRTLIEEQDAAGGVWGLRIVQRTRRPAGSVYPILERLEGAGWVTSSWEEDAERRGPRRRLYELSADGLAAATTAVAARGARSASPRGRAATA